MGTSLKSAPSRCRPRSRANARRTRALPLARLLPAEVVRLYRARGFLHQEIVGRWREIVGEELAGMCLPIRISFPRDSRRDGTLRIKVAPGFAPLVQHAAPLILERVNRHFGYGALARLSLTQGPLPAAPARRRPERALPPPDEGTTRRARRIAGRVRDPALAELLAAWGARLLSEAEARRRPRISDDARRRPDTDPRTDV